MLALTVTAFVIGFTLRWTAVLVACLPILIKASITDVSLITPFHGWFALLCRVFWYVIHVPSFNCTTNRRIASLNYFCCNYFSRDLFGGDYSHVYSKATSLAREAIYELLLRLARQLSNLNPVCICTEQT